MKTLFLILLSISLYAQDDNQSGNKISQYAAPLTIGGGSLIATSTYLQSKTPEVSDQLKVQKLIYQGSLGPDAKKLTSQQLKVLVDRLDPESRLIVKYLPASAKLSAETRIRNEFIDQEIDQMKKRQIKLSDDYKQLMKTSKTMTVERREKLRLVMLEEVKDIDNKIAKMNQNKLTGFNISSTKTLIIDGKRLNPDDALTKLNQITKADNKIMMISIESPKNLAKARSMNLISRYTSIIGAITTVTGLCLSFFDELIQDDEKEVNQLDRNNFSKDSNPREISSEGRLSNAKIN